MTDQWASANKRWAVTQEQLAGWLDSLAKVRTIIAPRDVSGVLLFRKVADSSQVAWGFGRTVMSVKEAFLPSTERLLTIHKTGQEVRLEVELAEGQQIIFGVRPCDARGVRMLDAVFLDSNPVDPYYAARRANTALVGLACRQVGASCFCTATGGAPDEAGDMDVMLYETGEGYLVEAVTERGRFLIPGGEWPQTRQPRPQVQPPEAAFTVPAREDWPRFFNQAEYWDRMAERCHSCRVCAYICPTCRCFAVRDEALPKPGEYERIRCWDSCEGKNYRLVAGGHRPRSVKGERIRNRMFCKFMYFPEQYDLDEAACTGCGRCIDACPVNLDITEIVTELGRLA
ncbi:MAG: hypothetical protein FJZ96_09705 [Chloroflexi bacterium]|nr:hypothetical protein [Chloroflexota bacterium]